MHRDTAGEWVFPRQRVLSQHQCAHQPKVSHAGSCPPCSEGWVLLKRCYFRPPGRDISSDDHNMQQGKISIQGHRALKMYKDGFFHTVLSTDFYILPYIFSLSYILNLFFFYHGPQGCDDKTMWALLSFMVQIFLDCLTFLNSFNLILNGCKTTYLS